MEDAPRDLTRLSNGQLIREYEQARKLVPPPIEDTPDDRRAVWDEVMRLADELRRRLPLDADL